MSAERRQMLKANPVRPQLGSDGHHLTGFE
jgi:hypothetical protein